MPVDMARFFKALGEETRLRIVRYLLGNERCACEFGIVTDRDQTTVSRHLKVLVDAGVLKSRKDGRRIIYSIRDDGVRKKLIGLGLEPIESCCSSCETTTAQPDHVKSNDEIDNQGETDNQDETDKKGDIP